MSSLLRLAASDAVVSYLANALVAVTVILLAALLVTWIGRRSGAAWRYSVCLTALLAVLISPALSLVLQFRGIALVTLRPQGTPPPDVKREPVSLAHGSQPETVEAVPGPPPAEIEYLAERPSHDAPVDASVVAPSFPAALRALGGISLIIWVLGIALYLARWCHGLTVIAALRQKSRPLRDEELKDVLQDVRAAVGVKQLPPIAASADVDHPVLIGVIKPLVVLPESALRLLSGPRLADVLTHECAHHVCRHQIVGLLQRAVAALLWPHPVVHLVNRELVRAREEVCDNYVLRLGDAPRYARTLLELSELLLENPPQPVALSLFHCRWRLEDRIAGLLDKRRRIMTGVNRWTTVALAVAFLSLSVPLSGTRILQAGPPAADDTAKKAAASDANTKLSRDTIDKLAQDDELRESAKNLREIMTAVHTYHVIADHFPAARHGQGYDPATKESFRDRPYLSWRVVLLPLLGERELFSRFKLSEPWDSEHNRELLPLMPKIYRAPGSKTGDGKTNYLGAVGPSAAFPDKATIKNIDIKDGTSKTIMLVEVPDQAAVEWTRPDDFPADSKDPIKKLVGLRKGGFLTAFADGAPMFISDEIAPETLKLLFERNDGRIVPAEDFQRWVRFVRPSEDSSEKGKR